MESKTFVLEKMKEIGLKAATALQEQAPDLTETQIIDREADIPEFDPAAQYLNWTAKSVVRDNNQVWSLLQPYDSTVYTDHPENLRGAVGVMPYEEP